MTTTALENKAMIVTLRTSNWLAAKTDSSLGDEVASHYDATEGSAQVRKQLIDKEELKAVRSEVEAARTLHVQMTLPWSDKGERLLPIKQYDVYRDAMAAQTDRIESARQIFLAKYDELVERAKRDLGNMFDPDDYPASSAISRKFGVSYKIDAVPAAAHFFAVFGDEEAERIRADIEKRMKARIDHAIVDMFEQIEQSVDRLVDRLGFDEKGNPKRIHASALDALQALVESVPNLNLTEDPRLDEIADRLNRIIGGLRIDDLRYGKRTAAAVMKTSQKRVEVRDELAKVAAAYFGS